MIILIYYPLKFFYVLVYIYITNYYINWKTDFIEEKGKRYEILINF